MAREQTSDEEMRRMQQQLAQLRELIRQQQQQQAQNGQGQRGQGGQGQQGQGQQGQSRMDRFVLRARGQGEGEGMPIGRPGQGGEQADRGDVVRVKRVAEPQQDHRRNGDEDKVEPFDQLRSSPPCCFCSIIK